MTEKKFPPLGRRHYIRINSVLPVQFRLINLDGSSYLSDWMQGFTSNIGKGGICLQINTVTPELTKAIRSNQAKLFIEIELPVIKKPIMAEGKIIWTKELSEDPEKYLLGLAYDKIEPENNARLMRYVRAKKMFVPFIFSLIIILGIIIYANVGLNIKLTRGNRKLVEQLVSVLEEVGSVRQKMKDITLDKEDAQRRINDLQSRIQSLDEEKNRLDQAFKAQKNKSQQSLDDLNATIEALKKERLYFQEKFDSSRQKENMVTQELVRLDEKKAVLEKANIDKMYKWLTLHQNPRSGLVMSFEGDTEIADWAFIYDQSLAAQAYIYFSDLERAKRLLDFFLRKAKKVDGLFINAYYASDGSPAEYTVHCGPNIWLGIAALHYVQKTKNPEYLLLAEDIARGIINLQNQDKDGGIRGGPNLTWYSTEHNLDAYAFFQLLDKITGKIIYRQAEDKILKWLMQHTYDKLDIPVLRGKGDSTVATDTYAWSIAAIGPEKLLSLGMDPEEIVEFAENNCVVEVSYIRPGGQGTRIRGFDFAPQRHLARGGVVSSEWTAQMVVTFKIMSSYCRKKGENDKSKAYKEKADAYLTQLLNMAISSPSASGQGEGCLPYASVDFVDTGHGWMTPKGKSTGSVSGTVYAIFAYYGYNPLEFKE